MRTGVGAAPALVALRVRGRGDAWPAVVAGACLTSAAVESVPAALAVGGVIAVAGRARSASMSDPGSVGMGVAGALASLAVFPRIVEEPARGIAVADRRYVDPLPDGTGLVVVVNASSGSGTAADALDEIIDGLPGATIRRFDPDDDDDLVAMMDDAAAAGVALGVVGGDGTVNLAARAALDAGVPLVVFPGGTLNHFARDLGLDVVGDAIAAVRDGQVVAIDMGVIAERTFVNNASIGSYSELVDERERLEGRLGKWPAMVVALVRVLRRGRRFEITLDGDRRTVWMVFFGNGSYEPAGFAPSTRLDLVDGSIDVRLIDASAPFSRARLVAALLLGALARSRVYERRLTDRVVVDCVADDASRLAADGETFDGPASFTVGKRPMALSVYVIER
ncbi:diacylglycerol/lipid kinase family protein [Actinospongicola halichondriae]|uniref:diacylglycerol/lipid kinase family protein n=1 Tax=Actinospongicola halichondriae TaxID=3236844 RepID=UPI003D46D63A